MIRYENQKRKSLKINRLTLLLIKSRVLKTFHFLKVIMIATARKSSITLKFSAGKP